jgi:hypothetical protein
VFERIRFARYALRFERAYKTDRWDDVAACFHSDAVYAIEGAGPHDREAHGPGVIVALLKDMLDRVDRRYDKRVPKLAGFPRVRAGVLHVPYSATYKKGADSVVLHGESACRFAGDKIIELRDTMVPAEVERWFSLVA